MDENLSPDFLGLIFRLLRYVHIAAGGVALTIGILPMILKKGSRWHNRSGLVYFWAMVVIFVTATPLSLEDGNIFLFTIGIFSFYLVFTGYRYTKLKPKKEVKLVDHGVTWLTAITAVGMIAYAIYGIIVGSIAAGIILLVFGVLCIMVSFQDIKRYRDQKQTQAPKHQWFFGHFTRMLASYIAATTAFLVNVVTFLPGILTWLLPTVIGTIGITLTTRHWRKKMKLD